MGMYFRNLTQTASRADWLSDVFFAVDGAPIGSKKLAVDILLKILNNFAPEFSPSTPCVAGKCYWREGVLYKCKNAHTGAWAAADFAEANLSTYAQNVAHSIAPEFDPTRTSENPYKAGETVMYTDGKAYTFKVDHYGAWNVSDVKAFVAGDDLSAINNIVYNEVVNLVGFGTSGTSAGVTQIGDIYYNTNSKLLREQVSAGTYETVPFDNYANYLNLSNGKNYVYDGTELVESPKTNRIDFLESNLSKTVVKTLDDVEKRSKGVFVSFTYPSGPYSMNPSSDSWESWVVDASELTSISATLGRSSSAQCNIVFLSSAVMEVSSIISHVSPDPVTADGVINYTVDSIPQGCKYVLISNRIATYQSPSATMTYKQSAWGRADEVEKESKKADGKLEEQIEFRKPLFYKCQDKITSVPTYANLIAAYDDIADLHSDFVTKNDLGVSSDGVNHLYEYVITTGNYNTSGGRIPDPEIQKPKILLMSGIHGYEPGSVMSLFLFFKSIFESVLQNDVLYSFETHIIPVVNPYGHNNNRRGNYNNVDINRNFDALWEPQGDPSENPSYYSGPYAASEAETVIVQNWIDNNVDAVVCIDFHNSSFLEVACLGGSSDEANMKIKKMFLFSMDKIEKYVRESRQVGNSYIMAYTYGSAGFTKGGSRAYMNKVDLVTGNVLETCSYTNALQTPDYNSIALGAECIVNFILQVCYSIIDK